MRWLCLRLPATLFVLSFATGLHAQQVMPGSPTVPRLVRISSVFRPADGLAPAVVESVILSIYKDERGGPALWQETQNVAMGSDGRYVVLLGATMAEGLPLDLFTAAEPRWLAVQFNRAGETEQPRSLLTSVPYALKAADADTLAGRPASDYMVAPTTAPTTFRDPTPGPSASAGTAGCVAKFVNSIDEGCSVMTETAGSIGLGTGAPFDRFHVTFSNTSGAFTGYAVQNLAGGLGSYSGMLFYDHLGNLGQFQGFNNSTHEYRINNIAKDGSNAFNGSINFMIGGSSKFKVASNGDISFGTDFMGTTTLHLPNSSSLGLGNSALTGITGNQNVAIGYNAIGASAGGPTFANTAVGAFALQDLSGGSGNTALGYGTLASGLTTGTNNIAIGQLAGNGVIGGSNSNNIEIGNIGTPADSGVIRVGTLGTQSSFFVAGVRGVTTATNNAIPVLIDSAGQLGTVSSSRRFKEDIQDMGDASRGLMRLRPVTFRYKQPFGDSSKPLQYGLIAEEVETVYPDLVAHSADGQIETVKYQVLDSMLLNEIQRQQTEIDTQKEQIRLLQERLARLEAALGRAPR